MDAFANTSAACRHSKSVKRTAARAAMRSRRGERNSSSLLWGVRNKLWPRTLKRNGGNKFKATFEARCCSELFGVFRSLKPELELYRSFIRVPGRSFTRVSTEFFRVSEVRGGCRVCLSLRSQPKTLEGAGPCSCRAVEPGGLAPSFAGRALPPSAPLACGGARSRQSALWPRPAAITAC